MRKYIGEAITMFVYVILVLSLSCASVLTVEENSSCTTPNGEKSTCIPINSCTVIKKAVTYLNEDALSFARASYCGKNNGTHFVCCGSSGNYIKTTPAPAPTTTRAPSKIPSGSDHKVPLPPIPLENVHLPDHTLCGIPYKEGRDRIWGGTDVDIGELPWMVVLKYLRDDGTDGGYRCSGTLINQRYVLTAAQCLNIKGFKLVGARVGDWKITTETDCVPDNQHLQICADPAIDVKIKRTIPHPYFSKRTGNNDIALLHLERKLNYTNFIRPICLPAADYPNAIPGTRVYIAGWGVTENGTQSDVLQKVQIPVVKNDVCGQLYSSTTTVNLNQVCAGGEPGKDACRGDSGGPLMRTFDKFEVDEEQWFQEAIIYRGIGCGRKGVPGLYTRLTKYINWILNEVKIN